MKRFTVLAVTVVMVGCGDSGPDGGAQLACSKWDEVVADSRDGVITDAELRSRIQSIESNASVSDEPGIATSARRMLAAVTSGDVDGYGVAAADFVAACNAAN